MVWAKIDAPSRVVDIDIASPINDVQGLDDSASVVVLARAHGTPIGMVVAPVVDGACRATDMCERVNAQLAWNASATLLTNMLAVPPPDGQYHVDDLRQGRPSAASTLPSVTIAICSRDRTIDLERTLQSVIKSDLDVEVLVVDNAPSTDATMRLVQSFENVRYVREPRPGLDWARNRAIAEATGEIVAFTDDDVVADPQWARAMAQVFAADPNVMAVTGLVVPLELEEPAQVWFERTGGFGRGYERRWVRATTGGQPPKVGYKIGTGMLGTGANMAFRRCVFSDVGLFDPALDVGTPTGGAGDLEMFFRVLKAGWTLVYEPAALVRHRHRRSMDELRTQIRRHGSLYSFLQAASLRAPDERTYARRLAWWWQPRHHAKRLVRALAVPGWMPPSLILEQVRGELGAVAARRYARAREAASDIVERYGPLVCELPPCPTRPPLGSPARAVRSVELREPITHISGLEEFGSVRLFVTDAGHPIGVCDVLDVAGSVSALQVRDSIARHLGFQVLEAAEREVNVRKSLDAQAWAVATTIARPERVERHEVSSRVSVIVATLDRPDDLRRCLTSLVKQERVDEIIVCDNNPASGLTPPVIAAFPGVVLVSEHRRGVAYARNRAILQSSADIVAVIDDDAVAAPDWVEKLIEPLARADVGAVTGNILPAELATGSQQAFEHFQSLGRGFSGWEADREWFNWTTKAVPTWDLGGTCNAAFRVGALADPAVGLLDEALGPGMPTGVGEDSYILYRLLKAGHVVVYQPSAVVWHHHRRDHSALERQLYNYYKGAVAHQLATLQRDRDLRAVPHLLYWLPRWHLEQLNAIARRRSDKPLALWRQQFKGYVAGPAAYARSRRRVRKWGRSIEGRFEPRRPVNV